MQATKAAIHKITGINIATPKGFYASGLHCGVKHKKLDLGLLYSLIPAAAAGVYTTNQVQAAPLKVTQDSLSQEGKLQAVIVNSGNANACTGKRGLIDAKAMQLQTAEKLGIPSHYVGVASTGVIGEHMPMDKISSGIQKLVLDSELKGSIDFSQAILTTDTVSKNTAYSLKINDKDITIAGTAKGSGMIHPNMATMLGFITTDAAVNKDALHEALSYAVERTFNCITVDGDTSTNDMVLMLANGMGENEELNKNHPEWELFLDALVLVCEDLGKLIAKDGEGASKLIEVNVLGAKTEKEARIIAKTVVGSPLVKTAVFGCDANWGRIIAAAGYSGVSFNPDAVKILIGDSEVVIDGEPVSFSEEEVRNYLKGHEIHITVILAEGIGNGRAWGCDLTYDYVQINASYRT
ncbi:bifunctional ornithine acetyltransferase/N-acetylglutamate synthase [Fictibacillus barbaricus]|uniref:Arginine biosynthesis bifunctional protein ArgJ n=1 Tax=Fictibacillus barbaricus TaxID=182136 RepID=A0ABS2ZFZ6_9BACL|nr:bifunctional ornithine acetyltransferase/N-acetylglutamate synthase [Fictibacillus barbaricus]MBN3547090.1 bifunctional ornithine acetyltransferase/N-acetylglutamate synthase [Fictibacillus barbaricus]GGB46364.1 arginine biosynthesis bifunctional protein ArgJ [Fictibacillus barbaricus]